MTEQKLREIIKSTISEAYKELDEESNASTEVKEAIILGEDENCNEVFQNQIFNHCLIGIWNPITGPNRHGWLDDGQTKPLRWNRGWTITVESLLGGHIVS